MSSAMRKAGPKESDAANIAAGLTAALGPTVIRNMIDSIVTPSGIATPLANQRGASDLGKQRFDLSRFVEHLSISAPTEFRLRYKGS